jgi:hypothetical protein
LALGPDGNLWYTRPASQRIGRCSPDGEILEFPLGDDAIPMELTAADDGTLLFTLLGRNRIGSIRACARPGTQAPAPGDGKASVPAGAPSRTEPKSRQTKRQRLKLRKQRLEQDPTLASLPRDPEPATPSRPTDRTGAPEAGRQAGGAGPAASGAAPKRAVPEPESKSTAAWDPADELYDRGVTLPEGSARHILDAHFGSGQDGKSVFRAEHGGVEGLEALLARGLAAAGGPGQTFDRNGRRYTYCRMDGDVGHVWTGKHWEAVNRFVIVSVDRWNRAEGFTEHVVLSAYPCTRDY